MNITPTTNSTKSCHSIQITLASQVATALQNARSFVKAQQQAEHETAVNLITQNIQSATTVESALQTAVRELGRALGTTTRVKLSIGGPKTGKERLPFKEN